MHFWSSVAGLSGTARAAARNWDFIVTFCLIDGFCFSSRMWHYAAVGKPGRNAGLDKGGMNASFVRAAAGEEMRGFR